MRNSRATRSTSRARTSSSSSSAAATSGARCSFRLGNQSFGSWGEVFGDRVIATAILDRTLHHAIKVRRKLAAAFLAQQAGERPVAGKDAFVFTV